jgi:hypothetical protein
MACFGDGKRDPCPQERVLQINTSHLSVGCAMTESLSFRKPFKFKPKKSR